MSDPLLSQLLAADSDLVAQEAKLTALLGSIQAKRASLKTVLEIFDRDNNTVAAQNGSISPAKIAKAVVDSPTKAKPKALTQRKATGPKAKDTQARKAASGSQSKHQGWRRYLRDEYRQTPFPTVVSEILQSQPQKVFEIAEVVDLIVTEVSPQVARKWVRKRVTNILAEGARKKQWHREGNLGCYRFSP